MALRRYQIQEVYLNIQHSLGVLEEQASNSVRKQLSQISVQLLRVKREMIGTFDEVEIEKLPL